MTNNPSLLTADEKLKAALYHSVSIICKSTGSDNTIVGPYTFHKDAIELISEIIFKKLEVYSEDLEAFAKNRKVSTVTMEDVKLLARRNPHMKERIAKFSAELTQRKSGKKSKAKSKTKPSTSSDSKCDTIITID